MKKEKYKRIRHIIKTIAKEDNLPLVLYFKTKNGALSVVNSLHSYYREMDKDMQKRGMKSGYLKRPIISTPKEDIESDEWIVKIRSYKERQNIILRMEKEKQDVS